MTPLSGGRRTRFFVQGACHPADGCARTLDTQPSSRRPSGSALLQIGKLRWRSSVVGARTSHFALRNDRQKLKQNKRKLQSLYPQKFALCSLHFAVRKSRLRGHVARCSHSSSCAAYASCELQAASCNFALCSSQLAARKFLPELRAATLHLAARSLQLAGSDTELKSSPLHVALRTSHFAVLAQGV